MIKIGLIGAGFMGTTHALCYEALMGSAEFEITAVADVDPIKAQTIAKKFNAKVYASGEDLLADADVNTIDICLPTYLHTHYALKAMKQGHHVFIEKPVCLNESETIQLLDMQRATGTKVMVGQCIRFWSEYQYLKEINEDGRYGKLISAVFSRLSPRPTWTWEEWLHDSEKSGSVALDLHIHDVDYVRYLLGNPDEIKSEVIYSGNNIEHIFSLYQYNDAVVSLEGTWNYPATFPFEMSYRVKFEQATMTFSSKQTPGLLVYPQEGDVFSPDLTLAVEAGSEQRSGNITSLGGYLNELRYFLERLSTDQEIENGSLSDGIESFRLTKQAIAAATVK